MQDWFRFFLFDQAGVLAVTVGVMLLTATSAVVGTFSFLQKKSLVGDAIAHAILPGLCAAFLFSGTKNIYVLILGSTISAWIALLAMESLIKNTKLKQDTAIALILSVFFGFGILLLTYIQHSGNASQSGLDAFLFGKAAAMTQNDLLVFSAIALMVLLSVALFFKELQVITFDPVFAQSSGIPVWALRQVLTFLTVIAVVTGIQAVGVVLMAAILITPAAAARFWTHSIHKMLIIAALMGAFSGLAGAWVSYLAPNMPTGPWIVLVISVIALFSFFFAPKRGILARWLKQHQLRKTITDENLLKELYHLGELDQLPYEPRSLDQILEERYFPAWELRFALGRLQRQGYLKKVGHRWKFTKIGYKKGRRMVKLHRLWEVYLSQYMRIAPDHVHEDAETIEHVITPELEARLEYMLKFPDQDPHKSTIPYA